MKSYITNLESLKKVYKCENYHKRGYGVNLKTQFSIIKNKDIIVRGRGSEPIFIPSGFLKVFLSEPSLNLYWKSLSLQKTQWILSCRSFLSLWTILKQKKLSIPYPQIALLLINSYHFSSLLLFLWLPLLKTSL